MGCTGRPWVMLIDWRSVYRDFSGQRNLNRARRDSVFSMKIYESRSRVDTTNNRLSENKQPAKMTAVVLRINDRLLLILPIRGISVHFLVCHSVDECMV